MQEAHYTTGHAAASFAGPGAVRPHRASWVFKGLGSVLRFQPLLARLAERSGLRGEADSLEYFLTSPEWRGRRPYLVLMGNVNTAAWDETTGDGLEAAVLLFEYSTRLRGSRVLSTADSTGRRNVLAVPECRAQVAAFAARRLLREGAHVVRIAFAETHGGNGTDSRRILAEGNSAAAIAEEMTAYPAGRLHGKWTLNEEYMQLYLPLLESFNATLARIGQRTRSNLRYYRRRCEQEHGATYVPKIAITLSDFLAFNAECTYAVSAELARWRYNTLTTMHMCRLCGVRAGDGRWLSMAGLRETGGFIELDWQMNRAEMSAASLATVLRSWLIEDEIARGRTRLYIEGGTTQPIRHSFAGERVTELIVKRRSLYVSALERSASRLFPAKNRLAQCLGNSRLDWQAW